MPQPTCLLKKRQKLRAKKQTPKKPGQEKMPTAPKKPSQEPKKEPKDLLHIQTFRCK
jgi:hypothetical protein